MSEVNKGKTYEEIFGKERAKEIKDKQSKSRINRGTKLKGKPWSKARRKAQKDRNKRLVNKV